MNRRGFLGSILAAGVAPYVLSNGIASGILMPVRKVWVPPKGAILRLYTGIPEIGGTLLATIDYPKSDFFGSASGVVLASGVYQFARLSHPRFGDRPIDLRLSHNQLVTGSTLTMMPFRLE